MIMRRQKSKCKRLYRMRRVNLPVVVVGSVKGVVGASVVVTGASLIHAIVHSAPMSFFLLLVLNLMVMSPA